MKKAAVVLALLLIAALVFGCSNSKIEKFNGYIGKIDKDISAVNKASSELDKLSTEMSKASGDLNKTITTVDKAMVLLKGAREDLVSLKANAEKARDLNANEVSTKYAGMIVESVDIRLQAYDKMLKAFKDLKTLVVAVRDKKITDMDSFNAEYKKTMDLLNDAIELENKAEAKFNEAQQYHQDNS